MDLETLRKTASEDVRRLNPHLFDRKDGGKFPIGEKKKNKYNAHKVEYAGIIFDSKREAQRYRELVLLQESGLISDLRTQVPYTLQEPFKDAEGNVQRAIKYTADFVYLERGITVIEDVKSPATAKGEAFRIRWRLLCERFKDVKAVRLAVIY